MDQGAEAQNAPETAASPVCAAASTRALLTLDKLLKAHEAWFDVQRGYELAGRTFPGFAEFHSLGEKYVLIKRAKLWEVATHEYLFFDVAEHLEEGAFAQAVEFMKTEGLSLVHPEPNHMSSNVSLVVIADSVDPEVERAARRVRFRKNFKWGLWGWSDLRVAVVDLASAPGKPNGRVITNAAGKTLRPTIEANVAPAAPSE